MRPEEAARDADAAIAQQLRPQARAVVPQLTPSGFASRADEQVGSLSQHASSLGRTLPSRITDVGAFLASEPLRSARAGLEQGIGMMQGTVTSNPPLDPSVFFPNRLERSAFLRDGSPFLIIDPAHDARFADFLSGRSGSYRGSGRAESEWVAAHAAELERRGIRVERGQGDSFTLTNGAFDRSLSGGVLSGPDFERFIAAGVPSISGEDPAKARWLSEHADILIEHGIDVQVEGNRFTLRNSGFRTIGVDPSQFEGSGFRGTAFDSFVDGRAPTFEGNNLAQARWIAERQQQLMQSGIHVYLSLNQRGEPSGRFVLQNTAFLPPSAGTSQREALSRSLDDARADMGMADTYFARAGELWRTGRPQDQQRARELASAGMQLIDRAQRLLGSVAAYVETSRVVYDRRAEIESLPPDEKRRCLSLIENADALIAQSRTADDAAARTEYTRRAGFLLQMVGATLYLRQTEGMLPPQVRTDAAGFLSSAMDIYSQGTSDSLERASFMLGQANSFLTFSIERAGIQAQYDEVRNLDAYVDVTRMPLFQTSGRFDEEKFQRLTGVTYAQYRDGIRGQSRRGIATVAAALYRRSLDHYDSALAEMRGLIAYSAANETPDNGRVRASLETIQREHEIGSLNFVRTAQLDPLISSARTLSSVVQRLPTERDIGALYMSAEGSAELRDSRAAAMRAYSRELGTISAGFLYLLSAQNSEGAERESLEGSARAVLSRAGAENQAFMDAANAFNDMFSKTSSFIAHVQGSLLDGETASLYGEELLRIGGDHLQQLLQNPDLSRPYFLRAVTDPSFLPSLPHRDELMSNVTRLGRGDRQNAIAILTALYDPNATPEQVRNALGLLSAGEMTIETAAMPPGGMPPEGMSREDRMREYGTVTRAMPVLDALREVNPELAARFERMREHPESFSIDQRRELILALVRMVGDEPVNRALDHIETYLRDTFREVFTAHAQDLYDRARNMEPNARGMQEDARLILSRLRPSDITINRSGGRTTVELADPLARDAYARLMDGAAAVQSIPEEMASLVPRLMERLGPVSREAATRVADAERIYQERVDEAEARRRTIIVCAVIGGLIAAPFTGGMSVWAAVGTISLGVGIGMGIPSVAFAVEDYVKVRDDPNATPEQVSAARNHMWREIGFNAVMLLPVVGQAGRAWAVGRGLFTLARIGYGLEIAGGIGMVGFGAYQTYEGVQMIRHGDTGWGIFNAATGALFMFGGAHAAYSGARSWGSLGRLAPAMLAPEAIARDVTALEEGAAAFRRVAAGEQISISADRLAEINAAGRRLRDMVQAGMRLEPAQMQALNAYRALMEVQPARDLRTLRTMSEGTSFRRAARGAYETILRRNRLASTEEFVDAIAARDRLRALGRIRPNTPAEAEALRNFDRYVAAQANTDAQALSSFGQRVRAGGAPLSVGEIAAARTAYDRLSLGVQEAGTATPQQVAAMRAYRTAMSEVGRSRMAQDAQGLASGIAPAIEATTDSQEIARSVIRARLLRGDGEFLIPGETIAGYRLSVGDIEGEIRALGRDFALSGNPQQVLTIAGDKQLLNQINDVFGRDGGNVSLSLYRSAIQDGVGSSIRGMRGARAFFVRSAESGDEVTVYIMGRNLRGLDPAAVSRSLEEATGSVAAQAAAARIRGDVTLADAFERWTGSRDVRLFVSGDFRFSSVEDFTLAASMDESSLTRMVTHAEEIPTYRRVADSLNLSPDAVAAEIRMPAGTTSAITDAEVRRNAAALAGGEESFSRLPPADQTAYLREARSRITFQSADAVEFRFTITDPAAQAVVRQEMATATRKAYAEVATNSFAGTGLNTFLGHPRANAIYNARNDAIASVVQAGLPDGVRIRTFGNFGPVLIEGGTPVQRLSVMRSIEQATRANLRSLAAGGRSLGLDVQVVGVSISAPMNYDSISAALISSRLGIGHTVSLPSLESATFGIGFIRGPRGLSDFAHLDRLSDRIYGDLMAAVPEASRARYPSMQEFAEIRSIARANPSIRNAEAMLAYLRANNPSLFGKYLAFVEEQGGEFAARARTAIGLPIPQATPVTVLAREARPLSTRTPAEIQADLEPRIRAQMDGVSGVQRTQVTVTRDRISIQNEAGESVPAERTRAHVELFARDGRSLGVAEFEVVPAADGEGVAFFHRVELDPSVRGQRIAERLSDAMEDSLRGMGIHRYVLRAERDGLTYWPSQGYQWVGNEGGLRAVDRTANAPLTWEGGSPILDYQAGGRTQPGMFRRWLSTPEGQAWRPPHNQSVEEFMRLAGDNLANYPYDFTLYLGSQGVDNIQMKFVRWAFETGWAPHARFDPWFFLRFNGNNPQFYPDEFLLFLGTRENSIRGIQQRFVEWASHNNWRSATGEAADAFAARAGYRLSLYPPEFRLSIAREVPYTRPAVITELPADLHGMPAEFAHLRVDPVHGRQPVRLLRPIDSVNGSSGVVYLGEMEFEGRTVQVAVKIYRDAIDSSIRSTVNYTTRLYQRYLAARAANPANWAAAAQMSREDTEIIGEVLRRMTGGRTAEQAIFEAATVREWGQSRAAKLFGEVQRAETAARLGIGPRVMGLVDVGNGNMAFAMERVVGVDRAEMSVDQLSRIARQNGISLPEQLDRTMRSLAEAESALARDEGRVDASGVRVGYDVGDFQFAVLTRRQFINGRWREPGDVVVWDVSGLKEIQVPDEAAVGRRVSARVVEERASLEGNLGATYFRENIGARGTALQDPYLQALVLSATGRPAFDADAFRAFVEIGSSQQERQRAVSAIITDTARTDPARAARMFQALRRAEAESGVRIIPQNVTFAQISSSRAPAP